MGVDVAHGPHCAPPTPRTHERHVTHAQHSHGRPTSLHYVCYRSPTGPKPSPSHRRCLVSVAPAGGGATIRHPRQQRHTYLLAEAEEACPLKCLAL